MCLGVPGRIVDIAEGGDVRMGRVDFSGIVKRVCLEHVRHARPGDYVLVHVGFALTVIDEAEAKRVFEMLEELGPITNEIGPPEGFET